VLTLLVKLISTLALRCICMTLSRLEFYRAKFVFERWAQEYPTFGDYTQGNKTDAAASKAKVSTAPLR
jgi:hypothetical protein